MLTEEEMQEVGCYTELRNKVFAVLADNGLTCVQSELDDIIARLIRPAYTAGACAANCFIDQQDIDKMFISYTGSVDL